MRNIENPIIKNPIPILTKRKDLDNGCTIPIATRSIPIASNTTEVITMIAKTAGPM